MKAEWVNLASSAENYDASDAAAWDISGEAETNYERGAMQGFGAKILGGMNSGETKTGHELGMVEVELTSAGIMNDLEINLETKKQEQGDALKALQAEVIHDKLSSRGMIDSLKSKIKGAISGLMKNPRSIVAALFAATALSGAAMQGAEAISQDQLVTVETAVEGQDFYGKKSTEKIRKAEKNQVTLIDNGKTEEEVIEAMDGLDYRIYAEFDENGQKIFEGTQFKRCAVPRPEKLGDATGHTIIQNRINTNIGFIEEDFTDAYLDDRAKSILVTDDYVFTLASPKQEWPDEDKIRKAFSKAKSEVNKKIKQEKEADPTRVTIVSDSANQIAKVAAKRLGLSFTVENKEDENGAARLDESRGYLPRETDEFDFTNHGDNIYDWIKGAHSEPYEVAATFVIDNERTKLTEYTSYSAGRVSFSNSPEAKKIIYDARGQDLPTIKLHTHPTSSNAFSDSDITSFLTLNNQASIVVGREKIYMLERDNLEKKFSKEKISQVRSDYNDAKMKAYKEAKTIAKDGVWLTREERLAYATAKASQGVADKYGFSFSEYSINSMIPDKSGDVDTRLARDIEEIYNNSID